MNKSKEETILERRQLFIQKYKETFGVEPILQPLMSDEDKMASDDYFLVLNYYGIKSSWL